MLIVSSKMLSLRLGYCSQLLSECVSKASCAQSRQRDALSDLFSESNYPIARLCCSFFTAGDQGQLPLIWKELCVSFSARNRTVSRYSHLIAVKDSALRSSLKSFMVSFWCICICSAYDMRSTEEMWQDDFLVETRNASESTSQINKSVKISLFWKLIFVDRWTQ